MDVFRFIEMGDRQYKRTKLLYKNDTNNVEVYEVIDTVENSPAVMKIVKAEDMSTLNELLQEAFMQKGLEHPNICPVIEVWIAEENREKSIKIVLEKLEKDVAADIKSRATNTYPYTEDQLVDFLRQIGGALQFAKSRVTRTQKIAHRDIKPANVLMAFDGTYKLADFGSAKKLRDPRLSQHTLVGTPLFLSPQLRQIMANQMNTGVAANSQYDPYKSDVYSLGLTMLYMALLSAPLELTSLKNLEANTEMVIQKLNFSEQLKNLLRGMLQVNEANRLNIEDVVLQVTPQYPSTAHTTTAINSFAPEGLPTYPVGDQPQVGYYSPQSNGSYCPQDSRECTQQCYEEMKSDGHFPPEQGQQYAMHQYPYVQPDFQTPQVVSTMSYQYNQPYTDQQSYQQAHEFYQQGYQNTDAAPQGGMGECGQFQQCPNTFQASYPQSYPDPARRSREMPLPHDYSHCVQCKSKLREDAFQLRRDLPCSAIACSQICYDKIPNRKCPKCKQPFNPSQY